MGLPLSKGKEIKTKDGFCLGQERKLYKQSQGRVTSC